MTCAHRGQPPRPRAVEILGALVASGDAEPYPLYAQLHELGDAIAVDHALRVTVA